MKKEKIMSFRHVLVVVFLLSCTTISIVPAYAPGGPIDPVYVSVSLYPGDTCYVDKLLYDIDLDMVSDIFWSCTEDLSGDGIFITMSPDAYYGITEDEVTFIEAIEVSNTATPGTYGCWIIFEAPISDTLYMILGIQDIEIEVLEIPDTTPPEITQTGDQIVLWPPNHKYHTIEISDCVTSVTDICDPDVDIDDVVITSVSSDEPENVNGEGDGNTVDDIVIVDTQTVKLRAERQGGGNGRVYTINFEVTDASGNTATGDCKVWVPHNMKSSAIDDGPAAGYIVY